MIEEIYLISAILFILSIICGGVVKLLRVRSKEAENRHGKMNDLARRVVSYEEDFESNLFELTEFLETLDAEWQDLADQRTKTRRVLVRDVGVDLGWTSQHSQTDCVIDLGI